MHHGVLTLKINCRYANSETKIDFKMILCANDCAQKNNCKEKKVCRKILIFGKVRNILKF